MLELVQLFLVWRNVFVQHHPSGPDELAEGRHFGTWGLIGLVLADAVWNSRRQIAPA